VSVLSESDAKRFGLKVRTAPVKMGDINGAQFDSHVAVADELSVGSIRLRHVAFLVVSDDQPPFNEVKPGSRFQSNDAHATVTVRMVGSMALGAIARVLFLGGQRDSAVAVWKSSHSWPRSFGI
jgi:hypothetical protein